MPVPDILKINEIFWSFQGEGLRFGMPSIFLRLNGCSLRCAFCDTATSWQNEGSQMNVAELMQTIAPLKQRNPDSQLVITGGEPLEQDLALLIRTVKDSGFYVAIETSGVYYQDLPIDWWALAPKQINDYRIHPQLLDKVNEIKLVVNDKMDVAFLEKISRDWPKVPVFLQPDVFTYQQDAYRQVFELFSQGSRAGLSGLRVGVQLHRIYEVQ